MQFFQDALKKTWQSTSNLPRETIVALEKEERVVKIIVFHDFNGNGRKEDFEPPLADTTIKSDTGEIYFTNTSGCVKIKTKQYVIIIPKNRTFRYVTWSTKLVEYFEGNLKVSVNKNKIEVPLAQGFLTFPLKRELVILSPFGEYRPKGIPKYHVGTDFLATEGESVYAPAPGKIKVIENDIYSGQCILVEVSNLENLYGSGEAYSYVICHIRVKDGINVGDFVERGELIGWVNYPTSPHIHFQVMGIRLNDSQKEIVALPLYESSLEIYTTSRFDEKCNLRKVYHTSIWTVWNKPVTYYKIKH